MTGLEETAAITLIPRTCPTFARSRTAGPAQEALATAALCATAFAPKRRSLLVVLSDALKGDPRTYKMKTELTIVEK